MRRILKFVAVALGIVFLGAAVFLIPTLWFKPWVIDHFYARVFLRFALRHPMLLSQLRILEPMGLEFHSDDLDDFSVASQRKEARFVDQELAMLRSYDRAKLSDGERLSYDVLEWFMKDQQDANRFLFHDYPVNQLAGIQDGLPNFMVNTHQLKKPRDAENYIGRVARFGTAFDQLLESLRIREEQKIIPPRFVIRHVLHQTAPFESLPPRQNVLFLNFDKKLADIPKLTSPQRDTLRARLEREIARTVRPSYAKLRRYLVELERNATDDDGVWKLPDGDAYYIKRLSSHTTTDLPPDSIHVLGLREVERIRAEMRAILALEMQKVDDPAAALRRLGEQPRFHYTNDDSGRRAILADYDSILAASTSRLGSLFGRRPKAALEVKPVPEFRQATSPGAYYDAPSFDGTRPGTFYANLRDPGSVVRFDMGTLACHEGIPGHHFQIAIAQDLEDVPFFRTIIPFTAYAEGWALYAERLALENGFYQDPYSKLGALKAELFRAARLVVDTGIHRKRWTREQAIDYMEKTTGMGHAEVVTEVERYIVSPGQACAYKVGQLQILALRQHAMDRLGSRFDIKEFHDVMLGNGALPMSILGRLVDEWIARESGGPAPG